MLHFLVDRSAISAIKLPTLKPEEILDAEALAVETTGVILVASPVVDLDDTPAE